VTFTVGNPDTEFLPIRHGPWGMRMLLGIVAMTRIMQRYRYLTTSPYSICGLFVFLELLPLHHSYLLGGHVVSIAESQCHQPVGWREPQQGLALPSSQSCSNIRDVPTFLWWWSSANPTAATDCRAKASTTGCRSHFDGGRFVLHWCRRYCSFCFKRHF
jgi:hypothetical protein